MTYYLFQKGVNGLSLKLDPAVFGSAPPRHMDRRDVWILFLTIFGRTDLRISLSGAKFDAEADFGVRFAVARQNPRQIFKKQDVPSKNFAGEIFPASKIQTSEIV